MMTGGNGQGHKAASVDEQSCARGRVRKMKKAGRYPVRVQEGPAKNPLNRRKRNAQQDTRTLWSLAGISNSRSKDTILNLVGFHVLLMKYDCNELGNELPHVRKSFPTGHLSPIR